MHKKELDITKSGLKTVVTLSFLLTIYLYTNADGRADYLFAVITSGLTGYWYCLVTSKGVIFKKTRKELKVSSEKNFKKLLTSLSRTKDTKEGTK